MRNVVAVVFDLDGVLVDSESINVRSAFESFEAFGYPLDPSDTANIVGLHPADYVPVLARRYDLAEDVQTRIREHQNGVYARIWCKDARLTAGAKEIPPLLRERGYRVALATSGSRDHVNHCLARFDLRAPFEVVLTKDDVARRKPDPEIYLACARELDLDPPEMLVVEDSEFGVRAAKTAGTRCAAVRTSLTAPDRIGAADVMIDTLTDLSPLLPARGKVPPP